MTETQTPIKPNQIWLAQGLFEGESITRVRISELRGENNEMVDVEYLNEPDKGQYRILPIGCLVAFLGDAE